MDTQKNQEHQQQNKVSRIVHQRVKLEMDREDEKINVWGARVHNLKNINVEIPRNSLTVITGLSGSGKSSLAFDTIYAEGQRRYIETFFCLCTQLPWRNGAS